MSSTHLCHCAVLPSGRLLRVPPEPLFYLSPWEGLLRGEGLVRSCLVVHSRCAHAVPQRGATQAFGVASKFVSFPRSTRWNFPFVLISEEPTRPKARFLLGQRPDSYQPKATPWVHRPEVDRRPTACIILRLSGQLAPGETMIRAFSARDQLDGDVSIQILLVSIRVHSWLPTFV
jgi:hypothetical protein